MMEQFEGLTALLPALKGAPGSVLWALSLAGRPLRMTGLMAISGYSRKLVKKAIQTLLDKGVVCRDGLRRFALSGDWPYLVVKKAAESPGILA